MTYKVLGVLFACFLFFGFFFFSFNCGLFSLNKVLFQIPINKDKSKTDMDTRRDKAGFWIRPRKQPIYNRWVLGENQGLIRKLQLHKEHEVIFKLQNAKLSTN